MLSRSWGWCDAFFIVVTGLVPVTPLRMATTLLSEMAGTQAS